ncbi:MAG: hypothetical protein NC300_11460 [Bacteroidales bacterium]|nr:hypothetical protein [Clostridium sp.]MCM1204749.1 hypothetical protein [Bacteroidales bacterium]
MRYTFIFNGRSYDLPKYTQEINRKINEVNACNADERTQDMEKYKRMHQFILETIGSENALEIFNTDNLDEIDLNEITICYMSICNGYQRPLDEMKKRQSALTGFSEDDKQLIMELIRNAGAIQDLAKSTREKSGNFRVAK